MLRTRDQTEPSVTYTEGDSQSLSNQASWDARGARTANVRSSRRPLSNRRPETSRSTINADKCRARCRRTRGSQNPQKLSAASSFAVVAATLANSPITTRDQFRELESELKTTGFVQLNLDLDQVGSSHLFKDFKISPLGYAGNLNGYSASMGRTHETRTSCSFISMDVQLRFVRAAQ